jgi:hypothetical protein
LKNPGDFSFAASVMSAQTWMSWGLYFLMIRAIEASSKPMALRGP